MPWLKIDDGLLDHKKVRRAIRDGGLGALGLHVAGLLNAAKYLTDGEVEEEFVDEVFDLARVRSAPARSKLVDVLVRRGLWVPDGSGGFTIHDYLDHNPSRADVESQREWDRRRQQLSRDPELVAAIKKRDRNRCRYCGIKVDWKDRRSDAGATYDHIEPRGPNTLENVVVACRGCNTRKGGRTPEQAGMALIPAPGVSGDDLGRGAGRSGPRPDPTRPDLSDPPAPSGGDTLFPGRPLGRRSRDHERAVMDREAWAREHFPDADPRAVVRVAAQMVGHGWSPSDGPDALRRIAAAAGDVWSSMLEPVGETSS